MNINYIIKYYESFASYKEKKRINIILRKDTPTEWELQFLYNIQKRLKVLLKASEMNVDSRMDKERTKLTPSSVMQDNELKRNN